VEPAIIWSEEAKDSAVPDVAIVLPDRLHLATGRMPSGYTDIVMEIVSQGSIEVDHVKKRDLYARTGVWEDRIIDRQRKIVQVWTFTALPARATDYTAGQIITSLLMPFLAAPVVDALLG
jgi:Uma2 family endonuclease